MDLYNRSMEPIKSAVIEKYPLFGVTLFNVPIVENRTIATAAVVGKKVDGEIELEGIEYNPDFFDRLSFDDKVAVLAHETCHIAFKHFTRGKDKEYQKIWNIATDACINAFLKDDGLNIPSDIIDPKTGKTMKFVDIADGLYRRAETIYDKLLKKKEEKNSQNSNGEYGKQEEDSIGGGLDDIDIDNYQGMDSHEKWEGEQQEIR